MKEVILGDNGKLKLKNASLYKSLPDDIVTWNNDIGKVFDILSRSGEIKIIKLRHTLVLEEYLTKKNVVFDVVG